MRKTSTLTILLTIPVFVFAMPSANGLSEFLVNVFIALAIVYLVSFISAFYYMKNGKKRNFYLSGILSFFIFALGTFNKAIIDSYTMLDHFILIPPLAVFFVLFYKRIKVNPKKLFWYYTLNCVSILLITELLHLVDVKIGDYLYYLDYLCHGIFCYFYVCSVFALDKQVKNKTLFINSSLICILSYCTVWLFYEITFGDLEYLIDRVPMYIDKILKGLAIVLALGNTGAFIAIRKTKRYMG